MYRFDWTHKPSSGPFPSNENKNRSNQIIDCGLYHMVDLIKKDVCKIIEMIVNVRNVDNRTNFLYDIDIM
jgi:hypothetical protein